MSSLSQEIYDKVFENHKDFYSFTSDLLNSNDLNKIKFGIYLIRTQSIKDKYVHAQYIFENKILEKLEWIMKNNLENQKIIVRILKFNLIKFLK